MTEPRLFIFGYGYTAAALARLLASRGWRIAGTRRPGNLAGARAERAGDGAVRLFGFDRAHGLDAEGRAALAAAAHVLVTIPPDAQGDPVAALLTDEPALLEPRLRFLGYLSTTAVYGDTAGGWVDETSPLRPVSARARRRVAAERQWRELAARHGWPLMIFRLPGIYGPGRSAYERLLAGRAHRIDAGPRHVFSRIHVADIARALAAAMADPEPSAVFNLADDEPAPAHAVVAHAAQLLGLEPPPLRPLAAADLSAMARSFYAESRRVDARAIKTRYGLSWRYPNYREGLAAILRESGYPSRGPYAPSAQRSDGG